MLRILIILISIVIIYHIRLTKSVVVFYNNGKEAEFSSEAASHILDRTIDDLVIYCILRTETRVEYLLMYFSLAPIVIEQYKF